MVYMAARRGRGRCAAAGPLRRQIAAQQSLEQLAADELRQNHLIEAAGRRQTTLEIEERMPRFA